MRSVKTTVSAHPGVVLLASLVIFGILASPLAGQSQSPPPTSLNIKFVSGLTPDAQQSIIAGHGGTITASTPKLNLVTADFVTSDVAATIASLQQDTSIVRVEVNTTRKIEGVP